VLKDSVREEAKRQLGAWFSDKLMQRFYEALTRDDPPAGQIEVRIDKAKPE